MVCQREILLLTVFIVSSKGCIFSPTYNGTLNITTKGYTCQRWDRQIPHKHYNTENYHFPNDENIHHANNYCRDASGSYKLWCYTTNPAMRWDTCNIPLCEAPDQDEAKCEELPANMTSQDCPPGTNYYICFVGIVPIIKDIHYHFECARYQCCTMPMDSTICVNKILATPSTENGSKSLKFASNFNEIIYFILVLKVVNLVVVTVL